MYLHPPAVEGRWVSNRLLSGVVADRRVIAGPDALLVCLTTSRL